MVHIICDKYGTNIIPMRRIRFADQSSLPSVSNVSNLGPAIIGIGVSFVRSFFKITEMSEVKSRFFKGLSQRIIHRR